MHLFTKRLTGEEDLIPHNQVIKDFIFEPQYSMMIHWGLHPTPKTIGNGYLVIPLSGGCFSGDEVSDQSDLVNIKLKQRRDS